jgi:DNA-binding NarL/FixJ family response regulator
MMSLLEHTAVEPPPVQALPPEPPVQPSPVAVMVVDGPAQDPAETAWSGLHETDVRVVATQADAVVLARLAPPARPEVMLLDLQGMSAVDAVQAVLATIPDARVLVVSAGGAPAKIGDLIAAVRGPTAADSAADRPRLTGREAEVLRLVASGLTSRQIATRLVLSRRTVENHVQRVMGKLQLHNRVELVRFAIAAGLG